MKKGNKKMALIMNRIMMSVMALLGFNSCGGDSQDEISCEYGSPYATYEIKGTVTNEVGEAIADIKIQALSEEGTHPLFEPTLTNSQGNFTISGNTFPVAALNVSAIDIDGEKNGNYETKDNLITITEDDRIENGKEWYSGKFSKEIAIKMVIRK